MEVKSCYAAVSALNYPSHPEHSVLVLDFEWTNLKRLLECPHEYLRTLQTNWDQEGELIRWTLDTPIVSQIEPIQRFSDLMRLQVRLLDFVKQSGRSWLTLQKPLFSPAMSLDAVATTLVCLGALPDLEFLNDGFFFFEFVIGNPILRIFYWPPIPELPIAASTFKVTPPILVLTPSVGTVTTGIAHVDIEPIYADVPLNERDRASLLMDLIEHYKPFASAMTNLGVVEAYTSLTPMDPPNQGQLPTLPLPAVGNERKLNKYIFVPPVTQIADAPSFSFQGSTRLRVPANLRGTTVALPRITSVNTGGPGPACPCVPTSIYTTDSLQSETVQIFLSGDLETSDYPCPR